MKPGFHAASLAGSKPLQRVLQFLRMFGKTGITTAILAEYANVQNVATWVSALRHNGFDIECKYEGQSNDGARIYRYWLRG